jgi:hypothetical protein
LALASSGKFRQDVTLVTVLVAIKRLIALSDRHVVVSLAEREIEQRAGSHAGSDRSLWKELTAKAARDGAQPP